MKTKYQGVQTLEILSEANNYNLWISDQIRPFIAYPALEIGAGTGNISKFFIGNKQLFLTEIDKNLVDLLKNKFKRKSIHVEQLDISRKVPEKLENKFKFVYLINVLEHIKNDQEAISNIYKLLADGGKVFILVPCGMKLYTKLDKNLGHYRRYEKKNLVYLLENSGFNIESSKYFNLLGVISWWLRDKLTSQHDHLPGWGVKAFDFIVPVLSRLEKIIPIPYGISIIVVASKK